MKPPATPAALISTPEERWELYAVLDIRNKLANGQAYLKVMKSKPVAAGRGFPAGTLSEVVNIYLTVNDYRICTAHRYSRGANPVTGPDPKLIQVDDLILKQ